MRHARLALLFLSTSAVLAAPAQAAKPKDGTFTGTAKYTYCGIGGCPAKLSLTVKGGKVTKFVYKIDQVKTTVTIKPKKALTVSAKGAFSYSYSSGGEKQSLSGQFTSASKVKGTVKTSSEEDSNQTLPKTSFTLTRK